MFGRTTLLFGAVLTAAPVFAPAAAQSAVAIPYERFTLSNGLTLIVHEDHKAPIVAINVWYHVGSKNERPGRTGFAHLFEHLMFEGSGHHRQSFFLPLQQAGAPQEASRRVAPPSRYLLPAGTLR